ncbi:hypothetical protein KM176_22790 [Pseudooceanicola sp. CBS1P-1]|uniref:Uncharacterized protein n=1 Tax=Pseudooceanicola albus TaxID=2692189 RepID=A0A6L7GA48_9RHOB|nr:MULTISPECIES: hypothetical protein [Pseudooceanicola]MBT9386697.1 hypothetical protein [Pseudooceanicola endophyticus]MXN20891.1 hypothetical protein [Pseudooceanicola albus]
MQFLSPLAAFLTLAFLAPVASLLSLPAADSGLVLVLSPPWTDRAAAIARAGGFGASPLSSPVSTLAQAEDPGFGARLRAAGPFLILGGESVLSLCGVTG